MFSINNELAALVSSSRIMVTKEGDNNPRPLDNGYEENDSFLLGMCSLAFYLYSGICNYVWISYKYHSSCNIQNQPHAAAAMCIASYWLDAFMTEALPNEDSRAFVGLGLYWVTMIFGFAFTCVYILQMHEHKRTRYVYTMIYLGTLLSSM